MAINFPTSLDVFTDPTASDQLNLPSHSGQHTDLNNAVEALEAKVGADGSAVTTSHDYKIAQLEAGATGGKILQVVSTTLTTVFSASVAASSFASVTGLTATITPSSTSSKILVMTQLGGTGIYSVTIPGVNYRLTRGGTAIGVGTSTGSRTPLTTAQQGGVASQDGIHTGSSIFLDSPNTTSATTYGVELYNIDTGSTRTLYLNRDGDDADNAGSLRPVSSILVMEVGP